MSQASFTATIIPKFKLGLSARIAILGAIFIAEKLLLGGFVDSERAQAAQGFGALVHVVQHWGFRFLVAFIAALMVIAYVRGGEKITAAATSARESGIRVGWVFTHILLVACLIPLSYLLYRTGTTLTPFPVVVTLWLMFAIAAALSAFLAMAPGALWLQTARALGMIWSYAATAALLSVAVVHVSQRLWAPAASLTFELVWRILSPIIPSLKADAATRVLSTDRFAVEVTEVCSGLEGMGLMLAFTVSWLLYFRREYIFPRALVLIPVGLATMFALNGLRIAALMLIGYAGFPEVAATGFHSQAGWIAFITVACALVFFSRRIAWLTRTATSSAAHAPTDNPTAAYLMPLLAILAAGAISHAMSGAFETFYPLRLIAGASMLWFYRRRLATLDWRFSWRAPAVGALIFLLWILVAHFLTPGASMPDTLASMSEPGRGLWIVSRVAASVIIEPLAEEMAYRGYLMRRLTNRDFESVAFGSVRWPAVLATAVAFGLAHGALWLPGIAAGVAYGALAVRRGSLSEAVTAHATTNALVAATVWIGSQWQLW